MLNWLPVILVSNLSVWKMSEYPENIPEGDDLSTESVEVLRERLSTMKQIMSDRKANQSKNSRDDFWTQPQRVSPFAFLLYQRLVPWTDFKSNFCRWVLA